MEPRYNYRIDNTVFYIIIPSDITSTFPICSQGKSSGGGSLRNRMAKIGTAMLPMPALPNQNEAEHHAVSITL